MNSTSPSFSDLVLHYEDVSEVCKSELRRVRDPNVKHPVIPVLRNRTDSHSDLKTLCNNLESTAKHASILI